MHPGVTPEFQLRMALTPSCYLVMPYGTLLRTHLSCSTDPLDMSLGICYKEGVEPFLTAIPRGSPGGKPFKIQLYNK